jgi:hypothetical protein
MQGDRLTFANGRKLTVVDMANPHSPQILESTELPEVIIGVTIVAEHILILQRSGLSTLHVDALSAPATTPLPFGDNEIPTLVRLNDQCFVATRAGPLHYLYLLDVGDPSKPLIYSKVAIGAEITDIAQERNLVMVGTEHGAVFLDVSNAASVQTLSTIGGGQNVALGNGFAYVNGTTYRNSGITVLDVHDPTHPVEIGSLLAPGGRGRMTLRGSRLFVDLRSQVDVIDVADRRHLRPASSIQTGGRSGTFFQDDHLVNVGQSLTVHRIGNAMDVPLLGERGFQLLWASGQVDNGRLYAQGPAGLFAVNVRDPGLTGPQTYLPGSYTGTKLIDGNRIYVYERGLNIGIHNLATGHELGRIDLSNHAPRADDFVSRVGIQGHFLHVLVVDRAGSRYELFLVDVSSAQQPRVVGSLSREGDPNVYPRGMQLVDDALVVLADGYRSGLRGVVDIVDVSQPHRPKLVSQTRLPSPEGAIAVDGSTLYVATAEGLVVLDARDRQQPRQVAFLADPNIRYDSLVVSRGVLYALSLVRMDILDVGNPHHPRLIATRGHLSSNWGRQLLLEKDFLIAMMDNGIQALPLHSSQQ